MLFQIFFLNLQRQTIQTTIKKWEQHYKQRKKTMTKSIKIQQLKNGQKYFYIYEVRVKKHEGEYVTYDRYLNEKEAEKSVDFIYEVHAELYQTAWIRRQIVWC